MSHVVVSNLAYAHPGGELLFAGVSFKITPAQHVGLVGANGVGKSTLFRVLAGELPADEGYLDIGTFAYPLSAASRSNTSEHSRSNCNQPSSSSR